MHPLAIPFKPTYTRNSGSTGISLDSIPFPSDFILKETDIITIPPGVTGGNHKHPRREAFLVFGHGFVLAWLDEDGTNHSIDMQPQILYVIPPYMPHAITNTGNTEAVLLEAADDMQYNVERTAVYGS